MSMLEKEFPELAKELNDEMKERRKNKSETAKVRKENVDRTHSTLANQRASVEEGKEESKKNKRASKYKHACHADGDFCLSLIHMANRPKVTSPEALCRKCLNLKMNLKATSEMEKLLFRLVKSKSSHDSLRPIYKVFENTERVAVTKEDLIKAIRKVAGATSLWSRLWSDRLRKKDLKTNLSLFTPC